MARDREEAENKLNVDAVRGDLRAAVRELRSALARMEPLVALMDHEAPGLDGDDDE